MKKLVVFMASFIIISAASWTKSGVDKKAECKKLLEHTFNIMKNDPTMKKMGGGMIKKIESQMKKELDSKVDECVKDYDQKLADCVLAAKTLQDLDKCGKKPGKN